MMLKQIDRVIRTRQYLICWQTPYNQGLLLLMRVSFKCVSEYYLPFVY
jgi:hypothetical protein